MSHDRFKSEGPGMQLCRDSAVFSALWSHAANGRGRARACEATAPTGPSWPEGQCKELKDPTCVLLRGICGPWCLARRL